MAITFVSRRASAGNQAAASSYTITVTAGTTGHLLLVAVFIGLPSASTNTASSVTDNGTGSAWQRDVSASASALASTVGGALFSTALGASPPTSLTLNMSAATSIVGWAVLEFAGTATSSWFDVASTTSAGTGVTTFTTTSATPAAAGELGVGCFGLSAASSAFVAGTGFTSAGAIPGVADQIGTEYNLSVSSGSQTAAASWTTLSGVIGWLAFYKAAVAGVTDHLLTATGVGH